MGAHFRRRIHGWWCFWRTNCRPEIALVRPMHTSPRPSSASGTQWTLQLEWHIIGLQQRLQSQLPEKRVEKMSKYYYVYVDLQCDDRYLGYSLGLPAKIPGCAKKLVVRSLSMISTSLPDGEWFSMVGRSVAVDVPPLVWSKSISLPSTPPIPVSISGLNSLSDGASTEKNNWFEANGITLFSNFVGLIGFVEICTG